MSELSRELLAVADRLEKFPPKADAFKNALSRLENAANAIGKAWSGSWLGHHARIYYEDLQPPPPGAHFSQEWGMKQRLAIEGTTGSWREFDEETVTRSIYKAAGNPSLTAARALAETAESTFEDTKPEVLSLLSTAISERQDSFLSDLKHEVEQTVVLSQLQVIQQMRPKGQIMSRDSLAIGQGFQTAPHIAVLSDVLALREAPTACERLAKIARLAASHLVRRQRSGGSSKMGATVFIGHGGSPLWRELKDYIHDRLSLPWTEFNRVSAAGVAHTARLSEMLDTAAIAFLVMTAEDELADGKTQARMNVVHEAGLFQGRLGFNRAIILLEDGCEEFSNIHGLGQIRFAKGKIRAAFEDVREVLEREGLLGR